MKTIRNKDNKLLVEISLDDLRRYGIEYSEFPFTANSKKLIANVLRTNNINGVTATVEHRKYDEFRAITLSIQYDGELDKTKKIRK